MNKMTKNGKGSGWHGESGRHSMARKGIRTMDKAGNKVKVSHYNRTGRVEYFASSGVVDGLVARLSPAGQRLLVARGEVIGSEGQLTGTLGEIKDEGDVALDNILAEKKALSDEKKRIEEGKLAQAEKKKDILAEKKRIKAETKVVEARIKESKSVEKKEKLQAELKELQAKTEIAKAKAELSRARVGAVAEVVKPVAGRAGVSTDGRKVPNVGSVKSDRMQKVLSSHSKSTREAIGSLSGDTVPKPASKDVTLDSILDYRSGETVDVDAILNLTENKKRLIELASYVEKDTEEIRIFRDETREKNLAEDEKIRADFHAFESRSNAKIDSLYKNTFGDGHGQYSEDLKAGFRKKKAEIVRDVEVSRAEARKGIAQNKYDVEWIDKRYHAFRDIYGRLWQRAKAV